MTNEKKQEFTRRVSKANSTEMIVILYDMTLEYIEDAKNAIEKSKENSDDLQDFSSAISHVQGCLNELLNSLNFDYEISYTLRNLYGYCLRKVGSCSAKRDVLALEEVINIIKPLRDAYDKIKSENKSGPIMGNSQDIVAGITYGRSDVNENFIEQDNRGFFV